MRIIGCLLMMYTMFAYPDLTANAARCALRVYGLDIVPTLFPYMVLTRTLVSRVQTPSMGLVIIFGLIGGSPSGASILDMYASSHSIKRRTMLALCALTGTISPVFLLNTVGTWLKDPLMTTLLVISHFAGAAVSSIMVCLFVTNEQSSVMSVQPSSSDRNMNTISASIMPILGVGGCLVFFSVLAETVNMVLFHASNMPAAFTHALLEISGGVKKLSEYLPQRESLLYPLISFSFGFSGLSILSQNAMFLRKHNITVLQLAALGLLRGILSAIIMQILMNLYAN